MLKLFTNLELENAPDRAERFELIEQTVPHIVLVVYDTVHRLVIPQAWGATIGLAIGWQGWDRVSGAE